MTGLAVMAVGLLRLGWIADFLSLPIVTGFLFGIGVIIVVHQLPSALGIAAWWHVGSSNARTGSSAISRLASGWSIALALGTLAVMLVGEKINARLPWALGGILVATISARRSPSHTTASRELGTVVVGLP